LGVKTRAEVTEGLICMHQKSVVNVERVGRGK